MTIKVSNDAGLAMMQALATYLDGGASSAKINFYDDTQPANLSTAANPTAKLVTCTLPEPCFDSVTSTYVELQPSDLATVTKTGTANWARLFNGNGDAVADFDVGTDITMATSSLILGGTLQVTSIRLYPDAG